jgi:hypothetical protein
LEVVLYDCETRFLTLREEYRVRVFQNGILRRIFEPKRDENPKCRRLYNKELHSLSFSPAIVRIITYRRLRMEERRNAFKMLRGKPTGKIFRRWEDNVRIDLKEIGINTRIGMIRLRIRIIG